jgi:hypothetical protein
LEERSCTPYGEFFVPSDGPEPVAAFAHLLAMARQEVGYQAGMLNEQV